jgi:ribonuclease-3
MNRQRIIEEFEKRAGYIFNDKKILLEALTHSSYSNEVRINLLPCNERLEFLGDAVLELISSRYIYTNFPEKHEGEMTRIRASYVCEPTLAMCAREIRLGELLFMGKGEEMSNGRERDSILSDALEATIGAVYLDGGYEKASRYIEKIILNDIDKKVLFHDSKSALQELVQENDSMKLEYVLLEETGPDHAKFFRYAVEINGKQISEGSGQTKKKAEQQAAYKALLILKK